MLAAPATSAAAMTTAIAARRQVMRCTACWIRAAAAGIPKWTDWSPAHTLVWTAALMESGARDDPVPRTVGRDPHEAIGLAQRH
jgi:hypothetical protein